MRYLSPPDVDDQNNLTVIANNERLMTHPMMLRRLRRLLRRYETYVEAEGNPWAVRVLPRSTLTEELKTELRDQYNSPPTLLSFIGNIRHLSSPDVCPMCGSLKPGTVDHVFPKSNYPEFSIFSRNLVPACDCNTKRGDRLKGPRRNQRVLHPYFDQVLNRRIIRADIQESVDGFVKPIIGLTISIRSTNRLYSAVRYHLENVLQRTDVIPYLESFWLKILRNPEDNLRLPEGPFTGADFEHAVTRQLGVLDRRRSTPNNWDSMLFAGIAANRHAKRFLKRWVEDVRSGAIDPEDI
jgi:hypothetical protein